MHVAATRGWMVVNSNDSAGDGELNPANASASEPSTSILMNAAGPCRKTSVSRVVTGTSIVIVNGGSTSDIITVKYNAAGVEQWVNRYDSHSLTDDTAYRLEIDTSGNAYVMGRIWTRARPEVVLIKINGSTGANTWTRNWSRSNG